MKRESVEKLIFTLRAKPLMSAAVTLSVSEASCCFNRELDSHWNNKILRFAQNDSARASFWAIALRGCLKSPYLSRANRFVIKEIIAMKIHASVVSHNAS